MIRNRTAFKQWLLALALVVFFLVRPVLAEVHPTVPALNSRPGAAYTMYLNFAGFSFNGNWGNNASYTPGVTPAYSIDGNTSAFSSLELANMYDVWTRVSESFSPFDINVTTVDPAPIGIQGSDYNRQGYYDAIPRMMHTVIGGSGGWTGGGGVSYVGVAAGSQSASNGYHTNWLFAGQAPNNTQFIATGTAHEDGHGLALRHQSDYSGTTLINEYSLGTGTGPGSVAPIMGNPYYSERSLWKVGTAHVTSSGPTTQYDAGVIASQSGMGGFIDDGIGHSLVTATPLPLIGDLVDATTAYGVIVPATGSFPSPSGPANYLADYWSFSTGAGNVAINLISGRSTFNPNVADPGAMLNGTLRILDSGGGTLATSSSNIFSETLSLFLPAGNYYAEITSAGDPDNLGFYDMGSYFLTGYVSPVPEPSTLAMLASGLVALMVGAWRRRAGR